MGIIARPDGVYKYEDGNISPVVPTELNEPYRRVYRWDVDSGILTVNAEIFPKGKFEEIKEENDGTVGFTDSMGRTYRFDGVKQIDYFSPEEANITPKGGYYTTRVVDFKLPKNI